MRSRRAGLFILGGILLGSVAVPGAAQTPEQLRRLAEQRLGQPVTEAEIIDRLRQSGMSRAQVRARLQEMGYDAGLADQYFDVMERGGEPPRGEASGDLVAAMEEIGVAVRSTALDTIPTDPLRFGYPTPRLGLEMWDDSLPGMFRDRACAPPDSLPPGGLPVFGRELFRCATGQFQPITDGPVDPSYRLGTTDQVSVVITGDVEAGYLLDVGRDGTLVLPDVGQIFVSGLTLQQASDRIRERLAGVYSGIQSGTTQVQVSLGRLRRVQVFVIGEVERPGAYQLSPMGTVFNALYQARGPNLDGSFRNIEVRRRGQVIQTVDLYDYLLRGDSSDDIRLEHGDIVFVPVVGPQVGIEGAVRRTALYELGPEENLSDLFAFAGGLEAGAVVRRVQIDRILPPAERSGGQDRVLVDVDIRGLTAGAPVALRDGDEVQVFTVSTERRNRLTVVGEVNRPGVYEWSPEITLAELLDRSEGFAERAFTPRVHIFRLNAQDGTRRLVHVPPPQEGEEPFADVALADRDSIVVYSRAELSNPSLVTIDGFVRNPGVYQLAEGMTVRDLILAAGGFIPGANILEAEVARQPPELVRTDTTAFLIRVPLSDRASQANDGGSSAAPMGMEGWSARDEEFELEHGDQVYVRKAPGYEALRSVKVTGQVMRPGSYVLGTRQERITDLLLRAGGLTPQAYAPGLQLFRDGHLVATDLNRALRNPGGRYDLVLELADSVFVPELDPTVLITGAVAFESRVLFEPGRGLGYYIERAGGYTEEADKDRVSVTYQDGERATVSDFLFLRQAPEPQPGSTIVVPVKPQSEQSSFDWDQFLTRSLSLISTTVTLLIAVNQL